MGGEPQPPTRRPGAASGLQVWVARRSGLVSLGHLAGTQRYPCLKQVGGEEELKQEEQERVGSQREEGLGESGRWKKRGHQEERSWGGGGSRQGRGRSSGLVSHPAWRLTVSLSPEAGRVL